MIYVYDFEVFAHDWLVVFKNIATGVRTILHNDNDRVIEFMKSTDIILCGFNNKHYDNHILKGVLLGLSPEEIKQLNDFIIIQKQNGWEFPLLNQPKGYYSEEEQCFIRNPNYVSTYFNSFDLKDDMQEGLSLKAIEAHLGMSIVESDVDFNIKTKLNPSQVETIKKYCCYDVDATEELLKIRTPYLKTKINLGKLRNISEADSLRCTNAQIVAKYLQAKRVERFDGRDFKYPPNLDLDIIPKPILNFFEKIHDKSIPDDELFGKGLHFDYELASCPTRYAWGGAHGTPSILAKGDIYEIKKAKPFHSKSTKRRIIQNRDVTSLYPTLMILYNCISRNIASPELFKKAYEERLAAKHAGDKEKATTLKLPLNTASGCGEAKFNDMYDPLPTRSMRIYGQLFLTDLVMNISKICKSFKLLNFNTDGILYEIDVEELPFVDSICDEWSKRTGFELETDEISEVWAKDVNNLLFIQPDGHVKKVGSYLNYGISTKGAFSINNNYTIVVDALIDYLIKGTPVEETIANCDNILKFQIIAKTGDKYHSAYYQSYGEKLPVQKVNRVYATSDKNYGTIRKSSDTEDKKIENIPLHCVIDNDNKLTINDIDKTWYVRFAKKRVNDFLGIEPPKINKRSANAIWRKINKLLEDKTNAKN